MSLSPRLLGQNLALALVVVGISACGASPEQPHVEVASRKQIPIPVCTTQLGAVKRPASGKAVIRSLDPEQWMNVLVPSYTAEKGLGDKDLDCTGHYMFANESLRGGISTKGWPRPVEIEELDQRSGPEGMRVLWLRVLKFENGDEGGPIALVRAIDDRAEVYGIGSFRGPTKSLISPVRLGNEQIVAAESTVCPDADDCRKRAQYFLARRGRLIESATVDLERTSVVPSVTERGLYAKYTLRTDVTYKPAGIQLLEQVEVKIIHYEEGARDSDRALRKVEFSRFLRVERDTLFSSNDPLWERVVGQD
ncbi:MAG: hypothetical protein ABI134_28465 [Byssovorax sp.]